MCLPFGVSLDSVPSTSPSPSTAGIIGGVGVGGSGFGPGSGPGPDLGSPPGSAGGIGVVGVPFAFFFFLPPFLVSRMVIGVSPVFVFFTPSVTFVVGHILSSSVSDVLF